MGQYTVRSGQNIYDVAITLYGSVDAIFDLIASNNITVDTTLHQGMILNYHEEFVINKNIVMWLKDNDVVVKNGEHIYRHIDMEKYIFTQFKENHPNLDHYLDPMSVDEKNLFWESLYVPRMIVQQVGQVSSFRFKLKLNKHLFVDWGDTSELQTFEGTDEQEIEHYYKGDGKHIITLYGDFEFELLDLSKLNGVYYPLSIIRTDKFLTQINIDTINKLIQTL